MTNPLPTLLVDVCQPSMVNLFNEPTVVVLVMVFTAAVREEAVPLSRWEAPPVAVLDAVSCIWPDTDR